MSGLTDTEREAFPIYARDRLVWRAVERIIAQREAAAKAEAWDEGHHTRQHLGPDGCKCSAWNESECGCGLYGTNVVTPNPYRDPR